MRDGESGFTLIEALVAMTVLATSAMVLLAAVEAHVARIGGLGDRAVARWVAQNRLAELRLGLPTPPTVRQWGRDWSIATERAPTGDPNLTQVIVRVAADGDDPRRAAVVTLTGFVADDIEPEDP